MSRISVVRACALASHRTSLVVFCLVLSALLAWSSTASAGLVFNTVRLDANVRSGGGSGGTAGVEKHFTDDDFPPVNNQPITFHGLPAVAPNPPAPLQAAVNLRMKLDEVGSAPLGGEIFSLSTLFISSATGVLFNNSLDNLIDLPVEFETSLYLSDLPSGQKLSFAGIRYEPPVPVETPSFISISDNRGSADDPINVLVKFSKDDLVSPVGNLLKVLFYWETMETPLIPEPATGTLLLIALVGLTGIRRHR